MYYHLYTTLEKWNKGWGGNIQFRPTSNNLIYSSDASDNQIISLRAIDRVSDCCLRPNEQFFSYIIDRTSYSRWDDGNIHLVLDKHA